MIPRATYRLQFRREFTFEMASEIVPYLAQLGISHIYASPILAARKGSAHGYDTVDYTRLNEELGGEEGFRKLVDRLKALGMPATDTLFERTNAGKYMTAENRVQPVCLLLSHTNGSGYEPEIFRNYRQFLAEAMKLMPFIMWKVKLHPQEGESFYREMGNAVYERLIFHPKDVSLEEAVKDADVVTTVFSTAGLESMIMDRPLIVAPATPRVQKFAWWPAMGGGTYAASAQEFQTQLTKLISDPDHRAQQLDQQRQFLSKSFANQGHAAEHIVDLLERYSDQPSSKTSSLLYAGNRNGPAVPSVR